MVGATAQADQPAQETHEATGEVEDWEDDDSMGDNEQGDEDNDETGAEADEIARRLGDQLWAEISKAQADRVGATGTSGASTLSTSPTIRPRNVSKQEAAIATMNAILAYAERDSLAHSTFAATFVPDTKEQSVLDFLKCTVTSGTLSRDMAKPLSQVIVSLAGSDALFATLRHSNAASIYLNNGKRKREQTDDGHPMSKRSYLPHYDLQSQLVPICRKMVSNLRAHQGVHAVHRPFRCTTCPASFARNHDLKRHIKLHDKKGWKCSGCDKLFSRRDAIKRHKNSNKLRGTKGEACRDAEIVEVELDDDEEGDGIKEERRAKMWGGISEASPSGYGGSLHLEEGEDQPSVAAQSAVKSLQGLLRAHIGNTLGIPSGGSSIDPTNGQATLASMIAQAQLQNVPITLPQDQPPADPPRSSGPMSVSTASADHLTQPTSTMPSLSLYGLSDEQKNMLEQAIANAASAAQAQAEAEAAMEEEEEEEEEGEGYEEEEQEDNDGD